MSEIDTNLLPKYVIASINRSKRCIDYVKIVDFDEDTEFYSEGRIPVYQTLARAEKVLAESLENKVCRPESEVWHIDDLNIAFSDFLTGAEKEPLTHLQLVIELQKALRAAIPALPGEWNLWAAETLNGIDNLYSEMVRGEIK